MCLAGLGTETDETGGFERGQKMEDRRWRTGGRTEDGAKEDRGGKTEEGGKETEERKEEKREERMEERKM